MIEDMDKVKDRFEKWFRENEDIIKGLHETDDDGAIILEFDGVVRVNCEWSDELILWNTEKED